MKPGDTVTNTQPVQIPYGPLVPIGTPGVVTYADMERGECHVFFFGFHIPATLVRVEAVEPVTLAPVYRVPVAREFVA